MVLSTIFSACTLWACHDITGLRPEALRSDLVVSGPVIVSPSNMGGWAFRNDQQGVACDDGTVCRLVAGPAGQPSGTGSAELATTTTSDGKALVLQAYQGTRFDAITELRYWTYRQSADAGNNLAVALQVNADYDLADQSTGYQGRLVFEPYHGAGGTVVSGAWQQWDALAGRWWGTRATVTRGGVSVANPCVQSAPCTWAQLLATFPNVGVHATYGAVVLKAGSGWASFRGNVDALTIAVNGAATTFDFELQDAAVAFPATFPGEIPTVVWDSLTAPGNLLVDAPSLPGKVIRDLLYVVFQGSASPETRAAAIASVNGRVIGGELRVFYAVRIPYALTAGDSASGPLLRALVTLEQNPAVRLVTEEHLGQSLPKYVRPRFGPGFEDWPLTPDSAAGVNWNLIGIDAPFAWGCATGKESGGTPPRMAVVDEGFYDIADLKANLGGTVQLSPMVIPDSTEHGTKVASVIAAVGSAGGKMTGIMWKADLSLFNIYSAVNVAGTVRGTIKVVTSAVASGNRVINLSMGILNMGSPGPTHLRAARRFAGAFIVADSVEHAANPARPRPLYVIAAGNEGVDAKYSGYATAAEDPVLRRFILVVAATQLKSMGKHELAVFDATSKSSSGPLVDVAAPGKNITTLGRSNQIVLSQGTSIAAPHVTGVAGLLLTFDPSLSGDSLRTLIIAGARNGGRVMADPLDPARPIPILNAYEALKAAAARTGAPLCGNRVYKTTAGIVALRGEAGPAELIIPLANQTADSNNAILNVFHGGKRIDLGYRHQFDWTAASRTFVKAPARTFTNMPTDGGMFRSASASSHDVEVRASPYLFWYSGEEPVGTAEPRLDLYTAGSNATRAIALPPVTVVRPTARAVVGRVPATTNGLDYLGYFVDADTIFVGSWNQPRAGQDPIVAVAPSGKFALVSMNFVTRSNASDGLFVDCRPPNGDLPPAQCTSGDRSTTSHSTRIFRVDLVRDSVRLVADLGGREMVWMAISEKEDEIAWQTVTRSQRGTVRYAFQSDHASYEGNIDSVKTSFTACTNKAIEYLAFDPSPTAISPIGAHTIAPIPILDGCSESHAMYGGTISPTHLPGGAPPSLPTVRAPRARITPMRPRAAH